MPLDLVLRGGLITDGVQKTREGDLGVVGASIVEVGGPGTLVGDRVIDCTGKIVSPGFIDAHSHGDLVDLLDDPQADALRLAPLLQGVTTQVVGNCGFSPFGGTNGQPVSSESLTSHLEQLMGRHARAFATAGDYVNTLARLGHTQNFATLAGHGSLVAAGLRDGQRSCPYETKGRVEELARWGVCGLSAGLIYSHGRTTTSDDLAIAASGLADFRLPVVFHIRGETHSVLDSVAEAIMVAERAGVPCHISHHKIAGRANWGLSSRSLALVEDARARGVDVTLDVYPYTSSSTSLHALLPPWLVVNGDVDWAQFGDDIQLAGRLLERAVVEQGDQWENMLGAAGWSRVWIAAGEGCSAQVGMSLQDVALASGTDPAEATMALLRRARGPITVVFEALSPGDVEDILAHRATMVGSDGIPIPGKPHQRWAGSHAAILGRYVRERSLLTLEQAVYKMSAFPAQRFGLTRRGQLAPGFAADIVVFDQELVGARATRMEPLTPPTGVQTVVINGHVAVHDGTISPKRAGAFLRPGFDTRSV